MLTFKIYHDFNDEKIKEYYTSIEKKENHLLNVSYKWAKIWWEVFGNRDDFGENKKLYLVCAYRNEKICAVINLYTYEKKILGFIKNRSINVLTVLTICGDAWGATFSGYIGKLNSVEINEMMEFIRRNIFYDWLYFSHIPNNLLIVNAVQYKFFLSACPTVLLKGYVNYDDFVKTNYSKKLRQNIRTANNHAKKDGYIITHDTVRFGDVDFEKLKNISISKLKSGKHSIYLDDDKENFVKRLIKHIPGNAVVMKINDVPVAYRLNFFVGTNKYCFDASFDRDYDKYDVGIQSLDASIRESFENRRLIHCEGTGVDAYKLKFFKTVVPIFVLMEAGNTIKAKLTFFIKRWRMRKQENITKKEFQTISKKYKIKELYVDET